MWKKNKPRKWFIVLFSGLFAAAAPAQETPVTLSELINEALQVNYQIQIRRNSQQIAANNNTAGRAGMLPEVSLSGEQSLRVENSQTDFYNGETRTGNNARSTSLNAMVDVQWTVFDGMKMFANRNRLGYLQAMGVANTQFYIQQSVADVALAYYQLVTARSLLKAYNESLAIARFRLQLEARKRKLGESNDLPYHQARVDYHTDSARVAEQKLVMRHLAIDLNQYLNRPLNQPLVPRTDSLTPGIIPNQQVLIDSAIRANQQLEQARLESLLADANYRIEQGDRYPEVQVFGRYSLGRQTSEAGFLEASQVLGPSVGVRVRFQLFDGGNARTDVRNAQLEQNNAALQQKDVAQQIEASMRKQINQYQSLMQREQMARESLASARESIQIARQQLHQGVISGYEFRQVQQAFIQTRLTHIALRHSLKNTEIAIYRLSNQLLPRLVK